ncbi:Myosin-1 [Neolecta irregularis DAH-3]|uniref:Myosin-1 n=1 Tax=Neolecta irregularis (strain DAH-3) TaxID=1198029 RepID=A0A1U7LH38_NEOID|nr:Myosin-1 [Neolecta irregularis DAH-3]|eukprot:OLL21841.1 Myosin-1 [Neolecta irregularis DAH-3]
MAISKRAGRSKAKGGPNDPKAAKQAGVKKAVYESTKRKEVGVSDLTLLSKISNEAINENLKKRFDHGDIYTYIGHVLISVNPFRDLGIYTESMAPHVFAIAESAYYNMNSYKENQCIIISGESGAGKTEAAKRIMQYIANVSVGSSSSIQEIKDMVLATNPLLESFGCAKTLRNNNSSRHGKYLQIQFNAQGEPVGADITNYLLEKGRIVHQIAGERNFHIFYQFSKYCPDSYREIFGIQTPDVYAYTSQSGCYDAPQIDDAADFADTLKAMNIIGLPQNEQDDIYRMLAVILWIGNVAFVENDEGNAIVADAGVTDFIAYLLDVDAAPVIKALTSRVIEAQRGGRRGSVYAVPLNITQAIAVRDALSKAIYNNLFEWIVERVNKSMRARSPVSYTIGILDIYGFEIFEKNSFEQLCINYVNEKLQQIFIQLTLKTEQEEYIREQIKWTPIDYFNNKIVCDLIEEKRPPGIFAALNDACATAHADSGAADSSFIQRMGMLGSNPHFQQRQGQFLIKHYAGDVTYTINGMTDKNKDVLSKDLLDLLSSSNSPFVAQIFPDRVDYDSKKRPPTAGDKIKSSANDLVNTLMQARPSYIRTIKPNANKSPKEYEERAVVHQIKYLGLQENVRIRRAGFAYRQSFEKFVERFYLLSSKTGYAGDYVWQGDARSGTEAILRDTGIPKEEWQLGISKAFIKTPETLFALEGMRDRYWHTMASRIQRAWRAYVRHKHESARKIQRMWKNKKEGFQYIQIRDRGHEILRGRKQRRRFSLLGSRRFLGDYLGIGYKGGQGEFIAEQVGLPSSEKVEFSCRVELLVAKLGRSSKPSPRSMILTNKTLYIVISELMNNQITIRAERRVPIGSIKYIGLSNLRDDWMSLGINSPNEPDPLIFCFLKTEFVTRFTSLSPGTELKIGPTIEFNKKPGKIVQVKAVIDETIPRDDIYKSGVIRVPSGEPANSISKPTPAKKAFASKTRPRVNKQLPKKKAAARVSISIPMPSSPKLVMPEPVISQQRSSRASIPRPQQHSAPAPPTTVIVYRGLYDFAGESATELSFRKDDLLEIIKKEGNGWWLAKLKDREGWIPENYVKEEVQQSRPRAPPPPPFVPAHTQLTQKPLAASNPRASVISVQNQFKPQPPAALTPGSRVIANKTPRTSTPPLIPSKRPTPVPKSLTAGRIVPTPPAGRPVDRSPSIQSNGRASVNGATPRIPSRPALASSLADALKQRQSSRSSANISKHEDEDW